MQKSEFFFKKSLQSKKFCMDTVSQVFEKYFSRKRMIFDEPILSLLWKRGWDCLNG